MLAHPSELAPVGAGWQFEVKWDGIRALARIEAGSATLQSRNGISLAERYPGLTRCLPRAVGDRDCVVDGEICALDEHGASRFSLLQQGEGTIVLMLFDLLELDGAAVTAEPWSERRRLLADLLDETASEVRLSRAFEDGEGLLELARARRLEGIVAKRERSPYAVGKRSRDWIKVKLRERETFRIAGYTVGTGARARLGALLLADHDLRYVGNCGSGLSDAQIDELRAVLDPLRRDTSPLSTALSRSRARAEITWVEPRRSCVVAFAERTSSGRLRAPVFERLVDEARPLTLTNRDKVFFPREQISKGNLLDYYRAIAPAILPHLRGRPVTMVRYPDGITGKSFFQKQQPAHAPDWLESVTLPSREDGGGRQIAYSLVESVEALLWMVNAGCVDLHVTQSRATTFGSPDFVLFDLDPAEGSTLADVARVALLVRDSLAVLDLKGYPKTSSADGMHVLVPIAPGHVFEEARMVVRMIAAALERVHPELVTTEWAKQRRRGVLIDANQVGYGRTLSAAYSVRPRPGAPVSLPLSWDEVEAGVPVELTMRSALERLERHGDLLAPALAAGPQLPAGLG